MLLGESQQALLNEGRHRAALGEQQLFSQWLSLVRKNEIYSLPDFSEQIGHEGYISNGFEHSLQIGFHASEYLQMSWDSSLHQRPPCRLSFDAQPLLRVGREDSRRNVFFGSLRQEWFDGYVETTQVAVKPFPEDVRDTAMHELAMYQYLSKRGIPTLEVLGVFAVPVKRESHISLYMLSRFRPGITTLDNLVWQRMDQQEAWNTIGQLAVPSLVALHASTPAESEPDLLFHGDTNLRNIAYTDVGKTVIVDVERTVSAARLVHPSYPADRLPKLMNQDFRDLTNSANKAIINGQGLSDTEKFDIDYQHIYLPYYEQVAKSNSPYKAALLRAWDVVVDQVVRQATGNW